MRSHNRLGRWLIAPALFLAFCSQGNSPSLTGPTTGPAPGFDGGAVGLSAAGDVKVGTGALEFLNLAIWGFDGDSGAGRYIEPGGTYGIKPGVEVKLWATFVEGGPANPKFKVEWGDGSDPSTSGCGDCKVTHTFTGPGPYTVKASLDDRISTMVTRTFQLDARSPEPEPDVRSPEPEGELHALFANGSGFSCPTGAATFVYTPPLDPTSSDQARQACEACYGAGACVLNTSDCAGHGWGPPSPTGQASFGFKNGCSGTDGRAWRYGTSYTTYGYWGRF